MHVIVTNQDGKDLCIGMSTDIMSKEQHYQNAAILNMGFSVTRKFSLFQSVFIKSRQFYLFQYLTVVVIVIFITIPNLPCNRSMQTIDDQNIEKQTQ